MQLIRHADECGLADFAWLDSRHTFAFGNYCDPLPMGFASLRADTAAEALLFDMV